MAGPASVPDVLADVDADAHAADVVDRARVARLEVAVLVEDAVVGQVHLVVDVDQLAVVDDGRGVVDVLVRVHEADDQRDAGAALHDGIEGVAGSRG